MNRKPVFAFVLMLVMSVIASVLAATPRPVPTRPPASAEAVRPPVVNLQDGRQAEIAANVLRIIQPGGRKSIAPPGRYATTAGGVITVGENGMIVSRGTAGGPPGGRPSTPIANAATPSVSRGTPAVGRTPPMANRTTPAVGRTPPVANRTTPAMQRTTPPLVARTTPVAGRTTPLVSRTTPAMSRTTPVAGRGTPAMSRVTPEPLVPAVPGDVGPSLAKFNAADLYGPSEPGIRLLKPGEILPPIRPGVTMLPAKVFKVKIPAVKNAHLIPKRKEIAFQPYDTVHSLTGQKLDPKAVITLPDKEGRRGKGKQMTVGELFAAMNRTEKSLNEWGMSMRTLPTRSNQRTVVSRQKLALGQFKKKFPEGLGFNHDLPLSAYLGLSRADLPEFPMEWVPAPNPLNRTMDWSPVHFLVKQSLGAKRLAWQVASEPFTGFESDWKKPAGLIDSGEDAAPDFKEYPRFHLNGKHSWQKIVPIEDRPETPQQVYVRFVALDSKGARVSGPSPALTFNYGKVTQGEIKFPVEKYTPQPIPSLELPGGDFPFGVFVRGASGKEFGTLCKMYDGKVTDLNGSGSIVAGVRVFNPGHLLDDSKPRTLDIPIGEFSARFNPIKNHLECNLKLLDESKFANPLLLLDLSSLLELKQADNFPQIHNTKLEFNLDQAVQADIEYEIPIYDGITLNLKFSVVAHVGISASISKTADGLGVSGQISPFAHADFAASGSVHPPGIVQPHLDGIVELIRDTFTVNVGLQPELGHLSFSGDNTIQALKGSVQLGVDVMVPSPKKAVEGLWGMITFQDLTPDMPISWMRVWTLDIFNQADYLVNETTSLF